MKLAVDNAKTSYKSPLQPVNRFPKFAGPTLASTVSLSEKKKDLSSFFVLNSGNTQPISKI